MAVLLRSAVGELSLRRFAPASSAAASRLFSNTAASSRNINNDLQERIDEAGEELCQIYARRHELQAHLTRLHRLSHARTARHPDARIEEADEELLQPYLRSKPAVDVAKVEADLTHLLRQSRAAETRHPDDSRIEEAKEELLQLYLRRRPALAFAAVEADIAHLLRQFEARSQHKLSVAKDDSDWRDSCESMEPEEFSTEPYVGEPDCASGYCFSGGSYTVDSYSGDMFWEKDTRER